MGGVGGVDDVRVGDVAAVFLADALEQALGARALDLDFDAGIFLTEARPDLLGDLDVDRGVEDDLPSFLAASTSAGVTAVGSGSAAAGRGPATSPRAPNPSANNPRSKL